MRTRILFVLCLFLPIVIAGQDLRDSILRVERLTRNDLFFGADTSGMSVFTASRSSKRIEELPITIHVITREEIVANHYTSLIDIVKGMPGVRVNQPGTGDLGETFQLRGLTGNLYTLIMINGIPVKPSVVTGMPILAQLPVRQAERIEVIYGPAAAIYGADAVSGVINIIIREADKGTFAYADNGLGLNEYRSSSFMIGGKAGKKDNILQYSFYGNISGMSDLNVIKGHSEVYSPLDYLTHNNIKFDIAGTDYDAWAVTEERLIAANVSPTAFVKAYYPPNYEGSLTEPTFEALPAQSNSLGLQLRFRDFTLSHSNMYRRSHSSLGQTPYYYLYNNPQNFWGENINLTTLGYDHAWSKKFSTATNMSLLAYRMDNNSSVNMTFLPGSGKAYRYSASHDFLTEQLFTVSPNPSLEIVSGISYQFSGNLPLTNYLLSPFKQGRYTPFAESVTINDTVSRAFGINPLTFNTMSVFSQTYYSIKKFRFMGGLRYDHNSMYGNSLSPRLAGLYIFNSKTSVRSSIGYAFKAPPSSLALQSLAYRTGLKRDSLMYIAVPNPNLKPENYMSVELGLIRNLRHGVKMDISLFYNALRNNIILKQELLSDLYLPKAVSLSDSTMVFTRINAKDAVSRLYGAQATFYFPDIVKKINLDAELNVSLSKTSESFPDLLQIAGEFLSDFTLLPNHFGQLKVSMEPTKNLYLHVISIWESNWLRLVIPFEELYNNIFKPVDGFYSMDVVVNYNISRNLSTYLKIYNLFDEKYGAPGYSEVNYSLRYSPQMGRNIHVGLTYTLN